MDAQVVLDITAPVSQVGIDATGKTSFNESPSYGGEWTGPPDIGKRFALYGGVGLGAKIMANLIKAGTRRR